MKLHWIMKKRSAWASCLAVVACIWIGSPLCSGQPMDADELKEKIGTVDAELKRFREGDGAPADYQEYRKIEKQWSELHQRHQKENRKLQEHIQELAGRKEVQDWKQKISKKAEEQNRLRRKLQSDIQRRGKELHARRREELANVAVANASNARALGFTTLNYPKVDGSTSTQPLGMIIACKTLGASYRWAGTANYSGRWHIEEDSVPRADIVPFGLPFESPSSAMRMPSMYSEQFALVGYRAIAEEPDPENRDGVRRSIIINKMLTTHAGTHGAYENVINGYSDIGLVARKASPDEMELAKSKGVELEIAPFALDAFVFIMNHKNPVTNLSTEQIREIYSGKQAKWRAVGGSDETINAYQRNRNSGSQELMETLVMKGLPFSNPKHGRARTLVHHGMGGPYIALSHDHCGLAYSVYYYEHFMAGSPNTKLIAVDGVIPSYETIRTRTYPHVTEVYIVTCKGLKADSKSAKLKTWLFSTEGQAVVRESGYVPYGAPRLQGVQPQAQGQRVGGR